MGGMELVKFTGADADLAIAAAKALQESSAAANKHKKAADAAKAAIARLLADRRGIAVDALPAKTVVVIQANGSDVVKVERKAAQRFDQTAFSLVHADLVETFTKETPATYYDSLI
jgi:hypothetical protein